MSSRNGMYIPKVNVHIIIKIQKVKLNYLKSLNYIVSLYSSSFKDFNYYLSLFSAFLSSKAKKMAQITDIKHNEQLKLKDHVNP